MATTETWVLDGVALTSGNFDILELTVDPPKARMDWVTGADSENGALMRQPLHENRTITMKLRVASQASMNTALDQVGAIRDKLRLASATADGIDLVWTPANSTRSVNFDVLAGEIPELPIGLNDHAWSWFKQRPIFTIELTCKPYWYGTEVTTSTASSSTPFVTLEVANVPGDIPALGRLIVTDTATQVRRHVEWGLENQFYNSGTSLLVDSDNMVTTGYAGTQTTRTGAYDPNATGNSIIRASLYSTVAACCGTGVLSHVGAFRVKARIWAATTDIRVRLAWQSGDGPFVANPYATPTTVGFYSEVDLGVVTISPKTSGTQKWSARVEAYSATGADTLDIDYLVLVPVQEGYGKARSAYQYEPGLLTAVDDINGLGLGTVLNARVAPLGGTWATSGSTTDFVGAAGYGATVRRTTTADTGNGRFAILGSTNYTDTEVRSWIRGSTGTHVITSGFVLFGVVARYVDASNWLAGEVVWQLFPRLRVVKMVAGVATTIFDMAIGSMADLFYTLRLIVWATGAGVVRLEDADGNVLRYGAFSDATLTGAGSLATGKPGLLDYGNISPGVTRDYDVFRAYTPPAEPVVVYSGRQLEIRNNETVRQDSTATYYGRPPSYRGSRFLVPPGTSRVLVKGRRVDVDVTADENVTDATQIQVAYTPRGLVVPR